MVEGEVSHDKVTRFLSECDDTSKDVWQQVKPVVGHSIESEVTKNEWMRQRIDVCLQNALKFRFVLMDNWFSSEENLDFITAKGKHFIAALKDNQLTALSGQDRQARRFTRGDELKFPEQGVVRGWPKGHAKEVLVAH